MHPVMLRIAYTWQHGETYQLFQADYAKTNSLQGKSVYPDYRYGPVTGLWNYYNPGAIHNDPYYIVSIRRCMLMRRSLTFASCYVFQQLPFLACPGGQNPPPCPPPSISISTPGIAPLTLTPGAVIVHPAVTPRLMINMQYFNIFMVTTRLSPDLFPLLLYSAAILDI